MDTVQSVKDRVQVSANTSILLEAKRGETTYVLREETGGMCSTLHLSEYNGESNKPEGSWSFDSLKDVIEFAEDRGMPPLFGDAWTRINITPT